MYALHHVVSYTLNLFEIGYSKQNKWNQREKNNKFLLWHVLWRIFYSKRENNFKKFSFGHIQRSDPVSFSVFWNISRQFCSVIFLFESGIGSERNINASNFTEVKRHDKHLSVFLNWPWNWSTITELLRRLWFSQDSVATTSSGLPLAS